MKQSKLESLVEACLNTGLGFFVSLAVWLWIVSPMFGIPVSLGTSFAITSVFTVSSIARGYVVRRFFNAELHKAAHTLALKFAGKQRRN